MKTQKAKVKVLDVLLQVLIAILSLGWMGVLWHEWRLRYGLYGNVGRSLIDLFETMSEINSYSIMLLFFAGVVFSAIVFVYAVFLSRKVTETVVRGLFTFSLVLWGLWFYLWQGALISGLDYDFTAEVFFDLVLYDFDMITMILSLLLIFFSVTRKKHKGVFIGQAICLVLLVVKLVLTNMGLVIDSGFGDNGEYLATGCFHLMLALLSIWLHRKNYYREQEACTVSACPYAVEAFMPQMRTEPISMSVPVVVASELPTMTETPKETERFVPTVEEEVASASELTASSMAEETEEPESEEVPVEEPEEIVEEAVEEPVEEPEEIVEEAVEEPVEEPEEIVEEAVEVPVEEAVEEPEEVPVEIIEEAVEEPVEEPEEIVEEAVEEPVEEPEEIIEEAVEEPEEATVVPEIKVMFCINCGAFLDDGASFCGKCGTKITE